MLPKQILMGVVHEYIDYYCNSLVKQGYLKKTNLLKGYQLTLKGKKMLLSLGS